MPEFFDYDPDTGVTEYFEYDEANDKYLIHSVQDVAPLLDHCKRSRDSGLSKRGIKENWWCYAKIPPVVIMQLRKKGINVFDPNHEKRVFQEINQNYPYLKMTDGKHE